MQHPLIVLLMASGMPWLANGYQLPGHVSRAFAIADEQLPSMEERCVDGSVTSCIKQPLKVAGWNLQRFGVKKMSNPAVVEVIVEVVQTYDLIVLQEVTDSKGTAVPQLVALANEGVPEHEKFAYVISPRIGRTSYKEQYAFLYKPARLAYESGYKYRDTEDIFQIEPYIVVFTCNSTGPLERFAVIPLHAKPSGAVKEIDALVDVYDEMKEKMDLEDAIILGDFNAGCNYVIQGEFEQIRLYTDERFHWLISDHVDTTTKTTSCPYDRIVVAGETLQQSTYYMTANTYYFDEALGIESNWTLVEKISDHYPVGVMIRGTVPDEVSDVYPENEVRTTISLHLAGSYLWQDVVSMVEGHAAPLERDVEHNVSIPVPVFTQTNNMAMAVWLAGSVDEAVSILIEMETAHPNLITEEAVSVLGYKLGQGALRDDSMYIPRPQKNDVTITLFCREGQGGDRKPFCTLDVSALTGVN